MSNFTFICGTDDFWVSREAKATFDDLSKDVADPEFGLEVINGAAGNVGEVEDALNRFSSAVQTLSLFGDKKVVWFKDITFFADSVTGRADGTLKQVERLKELLSSLDPNSVTVLLSASPVDRRRAFLKWCEKNSKYILADSGKPAEQEAHLRELVQKEAQSMGIEFPFNLVTILLGKINGNARLAMTEVRKLATYIGDTGEPVSEELLNSLVPNFGEGDFFETVEAFYSMNLEWTLDSLRRYFFISKDSRPLLSNLQNRNRLMIQMKALLLSGQIRVGPRGLDKNSLDQAAIIHANAFAGEVGKSSFNVFTQNPWYLGRLAAPLGKLTLKNLVDFQKEFLRGFKEILNRPTEQPEAMREMMVRCLSR
ncbi:MAG: DNA polymerase III subunit delta [Verrucomicrobia bacterium]|nr:DNA polymerase III subunit delta [Verrucomicrobiota bacterium]MDA1065860.1 DNA polymerase III subunit delta [Verrucomicrobiota bacterium]